MKLTTMQRVNNWKKKYPERYRAHNVVYVAVRRGELKPKPCEVCGVVKVESHHEDYERPLEVKWLCKKHHVEADKKKRERDLSTPPTTKTGGGSV